MIGNMRYCDTCHKKANDAKEGTECGRFYLCGTCENSDAMNLKLNRLIEEDENDEYADDDDFDFEDDEY